MQDRSVYSNGEVDSDGATDVTRQRLIDEFQASLQEQPDLDEEGREFVLDLYKRAINEAPLDLALAPPDRNAWVETIERLSSSGSIDSAESDRLIRTFDEAIAPLQTRDAKIALEFAQRFEADGEENALKWLADQGETEAAEKNKSSVQPTEPPSSRQSVIQSKSRRLRGPPRA